MTRKEVKEKYLEVAKLLEKSKLNRDEFVKNSGISRYKIDDLFGSYSDFLSYVDGNEEVDSWGEELEFFGELTYNKQNDCYILYSRKLSKNLVIKGELIRNIRRNYSDLLGDPATITELSRTYALPRNILIEILKITNTTHGELPLTDEELEDRDVDEIAEDLLSLKKFKVVQEFNKRDWQQTIKDARKWQQFESQKFHPWVGFLEQWQPPVYNPVEFQGKIGEKVWLAGLSDIHVGLIANERYNFFKGGWNHSDLERCVKEYTAKIRSEVEDRKSGFKECHLLMLGDICHGLFGFTDKGTKLEVGPLSEEQFDLAYGLCVYVILELLSIFPKVHIKAVEGNHSSFGDYVVAVVLQAYFNNEPRITFDITTKRYLAFKIFNHLFLMEHGYSAHYRARLPRAGVGRENYITKLFLANPELIQDVKGKYFLSADLHHFEGKEYSLFEHYMFSTLVGGDRHSDNCGYNNRPRQNCLIVDEDGIKEIVNIYFD